jgi:hypothetical protein
MSVRGGHGLCQAACLAVASAKAGGTQNKITMATRLGGTHAGDWNDV